MIVRDQLVGSSLALRNWDISEQQLVHPVLRQVQPHRGPPPARDPPRNINCGGFVLNSDCERRHPSRTRTRASDQGGRAGTTTSGAVIVSVGVVYRAGRCAY